MDEADEAEDTRPWQPGTTSRWSWYSGLGSPSRVLAPMVDQSEPAFRELCRRHGCDLAYTPMFNARIFADQGGGAFTPGEGTGSDRPLVVQFAGHEPASLEPWP